MSLRLSNSLHFFFLIFLLLLKNYKLENTDASKDVSSLVDYSFKSFDKSFKSKFDIKSLIPKIPKHIELYVAAAFSERGFSAYSKIFNDTLSTIPNSFLIPDSLNRHYNVSVSPIFFVLPDSGRFSSSIYDVMCNTFDQKRVAAILVIGESPAAFTVSMAAATSNIPVLWARGATPDPPGSLQQQDPLEIRIEPGEIQLLEAVRGVFLATHWHSFTVMAAPSLATRCASILNHPPLNPKVVPITRNPHSIFRKLADVSRSTRGVVLLLCDVTDAVVVMDIAKRLNMIDGHFVWIWIDTTTKPASFLTLPSFQTTNLTQKITKFLDVASKRNKNKKGDLFMLQSDAPQNNPQIISANRSTAKSDDINNTANKSAKKTDRIESNRNRRMTAENFEWKSRRRRFAERNDTKQTVSNRVGNSTGSPGINAISDNSSHLSDKTVKESVNGKNKTGENSNRTVLGNNNSVKNIKTSSAPNLDIKQINAQNLRNINEMRLNTKKIKDLKDKEATTWREFASMDYLNDFAVGDIPEEKDDEEGTGTKTDPQLPVSKAWGKITEHFPIRYYSRSDTNEDIPKDTSLPIGMLSVKPEPVKLDGHLVRGSVRLLVSSLHNVLKKSADWLSALTIHTSCWIKPTLANRNFSEMYAKEIRQAVKETLSGQLQFHDGDRADRSLLANFQILNLVPEKFNINFNNDPNVIEDAVLYWRQVGKVTGRQAHLDTIVWPGGDLVASALSARTRSVFRIVTALAPPFVMEGALDEDGQCLRGVICHRVLNSDKDNLTLVFNEMDTQERLEDEVEELGKDDRTEKPFGFIDNNYFEYHSTKYKYKSSCCYGLAMDLLENIAQELEFEFHLYLTPDGAYGAKSHVWEQGVPRSKWNGVVGDLVSGAAHMSFAALSVSKQRSQVIDFSTPYFFSGVSFLAAPTQKSEVPLLAFLLPFSPELWIAIFTSLNITAMAVACYEWLSPFGLNPWGRQRSRNFSIASALWVMWGLLCGHLVAFKAPKSWPNKFLINVWGGFSVIFVASYTANIAALIAGLFFHNSVSDYHDRSLLTQRVGAPRSSAADYYIHRANQHLWEHMQKYSFKDVETGIALLRNGSLDILIADTPILDYYRATDHGCKLQKIVESINEDTYAIGMNKGFPLKESISAVISKYSNNGYMDILTEKWYGGLPCFKMSPQVELMDVAQPRPLGVAAVAGVFLLLGLGMVVGVLILILEHLFYRYTLPVLRHQPKGTIWRSRNIMFFSQKLYRFINCVELVSPHHAARELVHTLRQGQITSLFQKSVKRKEHEQRRRRKSKAQFFEMIQEIRRVQQEERDEPRPLEDVPEITESPKSPLRSFLTSPRSIKQHFCSSKPAVSPQLSADSADLLNPAESLQQRRSSKSPSRLDIRRFSKELFSLPKSPKSPKTKSSTSLDVRRFSSDLDEKRNNKSELKTSKTDVRLSAKDIRIQTSQAIGRRLSKDASTWLTNSPPDINARRKSHLDITHSKSLSVSENLLDDAPRSPSDLSAGKFFTLGHPRYNEHGKELLSKSMTLTPVISKAATLRLASSGSLDVPKSVKSRPRLPSPPPSPVMEFRNPKTPKINISDASNENLPLYDTIMPSKEEAAAQKSGKNSHSRSKSLDNKHLNFGTTLVEIDQRNNLTSEKQTINYATLDHKRNNLEDDGDNRPKNVNEKFANVKSINTSRERSALFESRSPVGKNVPLPTVKPLSKDFKTIKNNTKGDDGKSTCDKKQTPPHKLDNIKNNELRSVEDDRCAYSVITAAQKQKAREEREARMAKEAREREQKEREAREAREIREAREAKEAKEAREREQREREIRDARDREKREARETRERESRDERREKQTPVKSLSQGESKPHKSEVPSKPKPPPKGNVVKQMQARAYSAPESGFKSAPTTVIFIPEDSFKKQSFPETNYYAEHRKFQKSESVPERYRDARCTERCFETFPMDRRCPNVVHPESQHRSRHETERRYGTTGRSSSVPEQRYIVTSSSSRQDEQPRSKRKPDNPVVILQHSSKSLDTPTRNPGILKNRRRSRSREYEGDLPPAPPSPPERRSRHERSEAQTNREILLTIKKQSQGYMDPP